MNPCLSSCSFVDFTKQYHSNDSSFFSVDFLILKTKSMAFAGIFGMILALGLSVFVKIEQAFSNVVFLWHLGGALFSSVQLVNNNTWKLHISQQSESKDAQEDSSLVYIEYFINLWTTMKHTR